VSKRKTLREAYQHFMDCAYVQWGRKCDCHAYRAKRTRGRKGD
jgi:hypothetical protein